MKAFIATSIRNTQEALRIVKILESLSIEYQCCITEKEDMRDKDLFEHNIEGIRESDIFISVLRDFGRDVSTEIGIAYSLGKRCIGVIYDKDIKGDTMSYHAAGDIVEEGKLETILKKIKGEDIGVRFSDFEQHKYAEVVNDINEMFNSKSFVDGEYTKKLEEKISKRYDRFVIATSSGTTSLITVLDSILKNKKEVIVPSFTFSATVQAIIHSGGKPVFAEIDEDTWTLNPEDVKDKITEYTGLILPVNIFGMPSDVNAFKNISESKNIPIVYDSCQAFGALTPYGEIGTFGDAEIFSLDATKVFSGGLGGFVTLRDQELYQRIRNAKNFGNNKKREAVQRGINGRLSEFNAILALRSLDNVNTRLSQMRTNVLKYKKAFSDLEGIHFQKEIYGNSAPQYFAIFIDRTNSVVNKIKMGLMNNRIESRVYNQTLLHKLDFFTKDFYSLPITEKMHGKIVCLPVHKGLKDFHIDTAYAVIKRYSK